MNRLSLSVVLPCFNEEGNVRSVYKNILENIERVSDDYEVIFVDDGSTDGSSLIISELMRDNERVSVIRKPECRGYGAALRSGFKASTKDVIAYMDCDDQYDFSDAVMMCELLNNQDLDIVGGIRHKRQDNAKRRLMAKMGCCFSRVVLGIRQKDIDCGLKVIRRSVIDEIMPKSDSGLLVSLEIYLRAGRHRLKVEQVPIDHKPRVSGVSKGVGIYQVWLLLNDLIRR